MRFPRSLVIPAVLLAAFAPFVTAAPAPGFSAVEDILRRTRAEWRAPGIAAALVIDGRIAWTGADGMADLEAGAPARPDTVWRIASVSKAISATAVMQLVERGKVRLDAPIWDYTPWYPRKQGLVITVRNILAHTSGIRHYRYEAGEKESAVEYASVEAGSRIHGVDEEPLQFTPGTRYLYSSYAYLLLAGVVESASGLTFEAFLRENIFEPAGMRDARLDRPREIVPRRASFYQRGERAADLYNAPWVDSSYKWAAGGLLATVEDLAKFAIALDGGRLLGPAAFEEAHTRNRLADGTETTYGLGWHIETDKAGRRWAYHSGGATGGAAILVRAPAERFAVVVMCNLERPGDLKKLAFELAAAAPGAPGAGR